MYQLTEAQIKHFHQKGWVGPLDTFTPEEVADIRQCLLDNSQVVTADGQKNLVSYNNIYGLTTPRDLHLFHEPLRRPFTDSRVVQRLNQLSEPDLLLWRSNIFAKLAHMGAIKWHQVRDYYWTGNINYERPSLVYPDNAQEDSNILNLTVWLAIDDAMPQNGCLQFANGTHRKSFEVLEAASSEEKGIFGSMNLDHSVWQSERYKSTFQFEPQDWDIETVPARSGQIVIFTESVMHSSLPNTSDQDRLAMNARYIRPSVCIYPHRLTGDFIDQNNHNIERHFSFLVSGQDQHRHNVVQSGHGLSDIEVNFHQFSNLIRFGQIKLPDDKRQLQIQALYQQATLGDCFDAEPNPIQKPQKYLQWQAWHRVKGLTKAEAMQQYSLLVAGLPDSANPSELGHVHVESSTSAGFEHSEDRAHLSPSVKTSEVIQRWMFLKVSDLVGIHPDELDIHTSFEHYGVMSADAAMLLGDLSDWLEVDLQPRVLFEYPTIAQLTQFLTGYLLSHAV